VTTLAGTGATTCPADDKGTHGNAMQPLCPAGQPMTNSDAGTRCVTSEDVTSEVATTQRAQLLIVDGGLTLANASGQINTSYGPAATSFNWASIPASTTTTAQTHISCNAVTLTGAAVGTPCFVGMPEYADGGVSGVGAVICNCRVGKAGVADVCCINGTNAAVDMVNMQFKVRTPGP